MLFRSEEQWLEIFIKKHKREYFDHFEGLRALEKTSRGDRITEVREVKVKPQFIRLKFT